MSKAPQYLLDGKACAVQELEMLLKFKYLPRISFETSKDQRSIRKRGIEKWKSNGVSAESQELGSRFIQKIKVEYIPNVSIRWLNESLGHGLFLEENLDRGSYVGEYTGIVRKNDLRRYFNPINNYLYEYPIPDEIGKSYVIDATQGNLTRFINHSFHPNLDPVYAFYDGFYHLIFLATHRIEKGTQLCYNYGKNYWYIRRPPINL